VINPHLSLPRSPAMIVKGVRHAAYAMWDVAGTCFEDRRTVFTQNIHTSGPYRSCGCTPAGRARFRFRCAH
jgi:hypothetical protein